MGSDFLTTWPSLKDTSDRQICWPHSRHLQWLGGRLAVRETLGQGSLFSAAFSSSDGDLNRVAWKAKDLSRGEYIGLLPD